MKKIDRLAKEYAMKEHLIYSDRNIAESAFKAAWEILGQDFLNSLDHDTFNAILDKVIDWEHSED